MAHHRRPDPLATALGWASLALGVPQLLRPCDVAEAAGVRSLPGSRTTTQAVGARELVAAAGLLGGGRSFWLWARVLGDAMDLTVLARALRRSQSEDVARTVGATAFVGAVTAVDLYAASRSRRSTASTELTATTTVNRPPQEVYAFWRRLEALPTFMTHLDEVVMTGDRTSHWRASAPFGRSVEWDAETTEDIPGERLGWRSLEGADVDNRGVVRFLPAPGGRGTEVRVSLRYVVPGGRVGAAVARYFGEEPHQQLDDDLRRFKQVMETGEVTRSDGAPGGKRARREFPQHAAQPLTRKQLAKERLA